MQINLSFLSLKRTSNNSFIIEKQNIYYNSPMKVLQFEAIILNSEILVSLNLHGIEIAHN